MIHRIPWILLILTAGLIAAPQQTKGADLPNIILIVADDLGINDLGCYGGDTHFSPHLDRFARDGRRFNTAYAAQPICSASRAAIMTGKHPARLHLTNYLPGRPDTLAQKLRQPIIEGQLPLEEITLAELLRDAGYATAMFGKWHLGNDDFGPAKQGFDVAKLFPENANPASSAGSKNEHAITDAANQFIEQHRDKAFFCYLAHHSPHIPLVALPEKIAKYSDRFHPTYGAMIESLDESVGRLLSNLDRLRLTSRTLVIFTSDNGGLHVLESPGTPATTNAPYRAGKGYLYEGGIRVPLLMRWPGVIPAGSIDDIPMTLMDLMPTILKAAHLDPARVIGPLDGNEIPLSQPPPADDRSLHWHFPHYTNQGSRPAAAIRREHWKLIEQMEDESIELFDLSVDPSEQNNLASKHPERVSALRDELHAWQKSIGAQMPTPHPEYDVLLHRSIYLELDSSRLVSDATACQTADQWKNWRKQLNQVLDGKKAALTPSRGDVRLFAAQARLHSKTMRYEKEPNKNVLGYWTSPNDWADWDFTVDQSGRYEVEVQVGCGRGSGGAVVQLEVAGQSLDWTVVETGHFQNMIQQTIGQVNLTTGPQTLAIKPKTKLGPAVMDLRRVVLRPMATASPASGK
jgi:arylsulfatase A